MHREDERPHGQSDVFIHGVVRAEVGLVAPRPQDVLRVAVDVELGADVRVVQKEVTQGLGLRLRERPGAPVGSAAGVGTGAGVVESPGFAPVAVDIHAVRAVGVQAAVFAPEPLAGPRIDVSVHV